MIKLIASDMDGTFLEEEGKMPKEGIPCIQKLKEKGITFVVATGRQTQTVQQDFKEVAKDIGIIAENGSVILYQNQEIQVTTIDQKQVKDLIEQVRQIPNSVVVLCTRACAYLEAKPEDIEEEVKKYYHSRKYVKDLLDVDEIPIKVAVFHHKCIEALADSMRPKWEQTFKMTVSGKHWLDFGPLHMNKGIALKTLQERLNIKPEACMAFGDYYNDLDMLQTVWHSYAIENAPKEVQEAAKAIIPVGSVIDTIYKTIACL